MDGLSKTMGQRIVELARLATAMHLEEVLRGSQDHRNQAATGGAGSCRISGADPTQDAGPRTLNAE
jgi:hypothetical protein